MTLCKNCLTATLATLLLATPWSLTAQDKTPIPGEDWVSLFDRNTLDGWSKG